MSDSQKIDLSADNVTKMVRQCYNQVVETYISDIPERENVYNLEVIHHWADNLPTKDMADLGCGDCYSLTPILIKKGLNYSGVELSQSQINQAKKNLPQGFQDKVAVGEMFEFCRDAKSNSFGGMCAIHTICHLVPKRQVELFQEIHRALVDGGLLLLTTCSYHAGFDETFEGERKTFGYVPDFSGKPAYEAPLPEPWYESCLKNFGFELLMVEYSFGEFQGQAQKVTYMIYRKASKSSVLTQANKEICSSSEVYNRLSIINYWSRNVPNKSVVSLGSIRGEVLSKNLLSKGLEYSSVEPSEQSLKSARSYLSNQSKQRAIFKDILSFCRQSKDVSFGGVCTMCSLNLMSMADQVELLQEIHRILVENGALLIEAPLNKQIFANTQIQEVTSYQTNVQKEESITLFPTEWFLESCLTFGFELRMRQKVYAQVEGKVVAHQFMMFRKKSIWKKK